LPTANFDIWDIIKVPFPYTNRPVQQFRPALVIGCHIAAGSPALFWVLMVTSATHRRWAGDVEIADLAAAGLFAPSIVRCAKIATIERADAERIGHLADPERRAVSHELTIFLRPALELG